MQDPSLYAQIKAQVQPPQPQYPEQEHLKCPRCDSANTKFCYYNNYNLSQPRHFCKNCRRYWTKGGALRNIPVGGGTRKNTKRSSSSSTASASKRPAPAVSAPEMNKNDDVNKNGETTETLALVGENFGGQFGNFMEVTGSFTSMLGSAEGQFGNLLDGLGPNGPSLQITEHLVDPGSGQELDPQVGGLESGSSSTGDAFLNIQGGAGTGDSGCWSGSSNGWPDLAIYPPSSNF